MSQKEEVTPGEVEDDSQPDNYKVAKKVAIGDLMKMDEEDEAMKKYKASLLGNAAKEVYARK